MTQLTSQMHISQAKFALDLLKEIEFDKSIVVSPLSISLSLGICLAGAKNETAEELLKAIAQDLSIDDIFQHFSNLLKFLDQNKNIVKMANRGYCSKKIDILDNYCANLQEYLNADFLVIDLTDKKKAAEEINKFVADSTDEKMSNFIKPVLLNDCEGLFLVSALYFEGKWDKDFTMQPELSPFYSSPSSTISLAMMKKEIVTDYIVKENYQFIKLPYDGFQFYMFILLPKQKFGLSSILKKIDPAEILLLMGTQSHSKGAITVPKFEIETNVELSQILQKLNIKKAFDSKSANFSGISQTPLYVSAAFHKATISVTESGTIASSATGISFQLLSTRPTEPFEFVADHPFTYFIADKSKNIYFVGNFFG